MSPGDRRELVLDAAVGAFGRDGYARTTVDGVAAATGVAKPQIYELFGSKEALFAAAVEYELERFGEHLARTWPRAEGAGVEARTKARIAAVFDYARERPDAFRLLVRAGREPAPQLASAFESAREAVTARLAGVVAKELAGLGLGSPEAAELLASLAIEATVAVALRAAGEPEWDVEAAEALVASFVLGGFRALDRDALERLSGPAQGGGGPD
jgi:AcrR family transcriptional regulator